MIEDLASHRAREDPTRISQHVRRAVLDRDNDQCQLCGVGGENRLQLHHIQYRSQGGTHEPANLITVCFSCHENIHRGEADLRLLEISPGVWASFPRTRPHKRATS